MASSLQVQQKGLPGAARPRQDDVPLWASERAPLGPPSPQFGDCLGLCIQVGLSVFLLVDNEQGDISPKTEMLIFLRTSIFIFYTQILDKS